jgi:hypothetical protein
MLQQASSGEEQSVDHCCFPFCQPVLATCHNALSFMSGTTPVNTALAQELVTNTAPAGTRSIHQSASDASTEDHWHQRRLASTLGFEMPQSFETTVAVDSLNAACCNELPVGGYCSTSLLCPCRLEEWTPTQAERHLVAGSWKLQWAFATVICTCNKKYFLRRCSFCAHVAWR